MSNPVVLTSGEQDLASVLSALRANAQFYMTKLEEALILAKHMRDEREAQEQLAVGLSRELAQVNGKVVELEKARDELAEALCQTATDRDRLNQELMASRLNEQKARDERDALWARCKELGAANVELVAGP